MNTKPELKQITNWIGALFLAIGGVLPYLKPEILTALGVPGPWVPRISAAIGLILIVYREKQKQQVLPPPSPEATRSPFFKPPENPK